MVYIKKSDENKGWAKRGMVNKRLLRSIDIRNVFMIYCEGENTEPNYFKSFQVNTETEIEILGLGSSKMALVLKVCELLDERKMLKGQECYDEDRKIWIVFDYDVTGNNTEKEDFNSAINKARYNGLNVAYSNDSFELWFALHFAYYDNALRRSDYYQILSKQFSLNYEKYGKERDFSKSLYSLLCSNQNVAIQNAKKLYNIHEGNNYHQHNPCTNVFELVEELNKCLKK